MDFYEPGSRALRLFNHFHDGMKLVGLQGSVFSTPAALPTDDHRSDLLDSDESGDDHRDSDFLDSVHGGAAGVFEIPRMPAQAPAASSAPRASASPEPDPAQAPAASSAPRASASPEPDPAQSPAASSALRASASPEPEPAQGGAASSAPPPPAPHPVARRRGDRQRRAVATWGPFQIAEYHPGGVQKGWGATCGLHWNAGDSQECKRPLQYRGRGGRHPLDDAGCVRQLKRWLLAGLSIASDDPEGRRKHMAMDPRTLGPQRHPEDLDAPP